ncbi:MAG: CopD family protein [candidate division WOR-3 bacterium]|jgi:putative copper export protein
MKTLYFISVFIHIISACIWFGGMFALIIFFLPLRKEQYFLDVVKKLGEQFKIVGWIILPLLFITGFFNLHYRGFDFSFSTTYNKIIWLKIILFFVIVIISAIHDFYIGPKAIKTRDKKLLKYSRTIGRINFILAIIMILIGIFIVRGL